jgi:hypothetical protein
MPACNRYVAAALRGAAAVTFADYNPEVLETLTAPNVQANAPDMIAAAAAAAAVNNSTNKHGSSEPLPPQPPVFRYLGGDWAHLHDFIAPQSADVAGPLHKSNPFETIA